MSEYPLFLLTFNPFGEQKPASSVHMQLQNFAQPNLKEPTKRRHWGVKREPSQQIRRRGKQEIILRLRVRVACRRCAQGGITSLLMKGSTQLNFHSMDYFA